MSKGFSSSAADAVLFSSFLNFLGNLQVSLFLFVHARNIVPDFFFILGSTVQHTLGTDHYQQYLRNPIVCHNLIILHHLNTDSRPSGLKKMNTWNTNTYTAAKNATKTLAAKSLIGFKSDTCKKSLSLSHFFPLEFVQLLTVRFSSCLNTIQFCCQHHWLTRVTFNVTMQHYTRRRNGKRTNSRQKREENISRSIITNGRRSGKTYSGQSAFARRSSLLEGWPHIIHHFIVFTPGIVAACSVSTQQTYPTSEHWWSRRHWISGALSGFRCILPMRILFLAQFIPVVHFTTKNRHT